MRGKVECCGWLNEIMYIMKYAFSNMKWKLIRHNTVQLSQDCERYNYVELKQKLN